MATTLFVFLAVCGLSVGESLDVEMHQSESAVQIALASSGSMVGQRKASKMRREHQIKAMVRKFDQSLLDGDVGTRTEQTSTTTWRPPSVSCGGHKAARCRLCTVIDPYTGAEIADQGPEWCHGHCTYYDGECHSMTAANLNKERDNYTLDATTTPPVPDLLNPNITHLDRDIMEIAAKRALEEGRFESSQRLSNQHEIREEKADTTNKYIYYVIIGCSGYLACCAFFATTVVCLGMRKSKGTSGILEDVGEVDKGTTADDGTREF